MQLLIFSNDIVIVVFCSATFLSNIFKIMSIKIGINITLYQRNGYFPCPMNSQLAMVSGL